MVCYDGQHDASTSKVSARSANQNVSHNPLGKLYTINPKSTKFNAIQSMVNAKITATKVNETRSKSMFSLDFCAKKYELQKSEFWAVNLTMH